MIFTMTEKIQTITQDDLIRLDVEYDELWVEVDKAQSLLQNIIAPFWI
jgi:hypothetical protein